jgi:hypothetical protein
MPEPNKPAPAAPLAERLDIGKPSTVRVDTYMQAILMGVVQQKGVKLTIGTMADIRNLALMAIAAIDGAK